MTYIIDTCVLLDYPQIVEDKNNQLIIATSVLKELDGLKKHNNPETAAAARRAAVYISRNLDNLDWYSDCENWNIPVDDQLLRITKELSGILLTNDVYLKVKALIDGINTKGYGNKDDYIGVEYWYLNFDSNYYNARLAHVFETGKKPEEIKLYENQYLIVKNLDSIVMTRHQEEDYEIMACFVYRNGRLMQIDNLKIKNKWINCIVPKNAEQMCLFEALNNKDINILYAGGKFGTGY